MNFLVILISLAVVVGVVYYVRSKRNSTSSGNSSIEEPSKNKID
jgi:hypothetical protein